MAYSFYNTHGAGYTFSEYIHPGYIYEARKVVDGQVRAPKPRRSL